MICDPCKRRDHHLCVDLHLIDSGRTGCPCQHRAGGFSTSTLNSDGTRTEGVYGASGPRGSALFARGGLIESGTPFTNTSSEPIVAEPPYKVLPDDSTVSQILREVAQHGR